MAAHYHNPSKAMKVASLCSWYPVDILMAELKALRSINFNVANDRQQALERIAKIPNVCPFNTSAVNPMQFPDEFYICEGLGDWTRKFMQLKSALSHRDGSIGKFARTQDVRVESDVGKEQAASDAQQAFWNVTTSMIDEIIRLDHVYDRASFEAYFQADWH
jgi:hypothetical protein